MSSNSLQKHAQADVWAKKQRLTSQLVRFCYAYLAKTKRVKADTIHALAKLTWITKNYDKAVTDSSYVISTKLPALGTIFNRDYSGWSLDRVSADIQAITGEPTSKVKPIIAGHTGFTNFYKVYRNSSLEWIRTNQAAIKTILKDTYSLATDNQGASVAERIGRLPSIPAPSGERATRPEYLLTPPMFLS
jgi:hypothetical protein